MRGQIDILNCGKGHAEIVVDDSNPVEMERGARIIQDMLKRGYALFVHGKDQELIRVQEFDSKHKTYIIGAEATLDPEDEAVVTPAKGKHGRPRKQLPMAKGKVVAIGRSAGG